MDHEQRGKFLIGLSNIMLRDLLVYRTGIEYFKRNPADSFDGVDKIMAQTRSDPAVGNQLRDDFQVYLEGVLQLENADPRTVLEKFLSEWFPRSAAN